MIDTMTLFDVEELIRYWIDHPPVHLMIGAYLGVGKRRGNRLEHPWTRISMGSASAGELLAELGPAFKNDDVHAGLNPVALDIAELRRNAGARAEPKRAAHDQAPNWDEP